MATRQDKIAASQLARKIKLEESFKPKLTRFFNQMAKDINITWVATGNIPTLKPFKPELITLLREHYRKVDKAFNGEVQKEAKHVGLALETKAGEELVENDVMNYIMSHSITQSGIILATTQREMQAIVSQVLINSALQDVPFTQLQIGNELKKEFVSKTGARVSTIAITETNTVAEQVKYIEAGAFADQVRGAGQVLIDTWNTTLDERTRSSHVAADRQEIKHGTAFTVQGQKLRFPGDMSMGATLDNVINCRCGSVTSIQKGTTPIAIDPFASLISTRLN